MALRKFGNTKSHLKPETQARFFTNSSERIKQWSDIAINDKYLLLVTVLWLGGIILGSLIIILFLPKVPTEIPLFYSRNWGTEQLAPKSYLLIIPGGIFLLGLVNMSLGVANYNRDKLIAYMLGLATCTITLLGLFSVINIIHLLT